MPITGSHLVPVNTGEDLCGTTDGERSLDEGKGCSYGAIGADRQSIDWCVRSRMSGSPHIGGTRAWTSSEFKGIAEKAAKVAGVYTPPSTLAASGQGLRSRKQKDADQQTYCKCPEA